MAFASVVPPIVGVASLVIPSVELVPLSVDSAVMAGAAGAVVSIVTTNSAEAALVFPAASVALAVNLQSAGAKGVP